MDPHACVSALRFHDRFYITFLPFLFWSGNQRLARSATLLMATCIYSGNAIKDVVCAPRPSCPPVERIGGAERGGEHAEEYGFASTHTINSFVLSAFVAWHCGYRPWRALGVEPAVADAAVWSAVLLWTAAVMYSRIYLGMHSPVDVVAGFAIGVVTLVFWVLLDPFVEAFITDTTSAVVPFQLTMSVLLVNAYPVPLRRTPSFTYAVYFSGVCSGVVIGVWRTYTRFHDAAAQAAARAHLWRPVSENLGVGAAEAALSAVAGESGVVGLRVLARFVVGLAIVLAARAVTKAVASRVLMRLCLVVGFGVPATPVPRTRTTGAARGGAAADGDGGSKSERGVSVDVSRVETAVRLLTYGAVGWAVVEPAMMAFEALGI